MRDIDALTTAACTLKFSTLSQQPTVSKAARLAYGINCKGVVVVSVGTYLCLQQAAGCRMVTYCCVVQSLHHSQEWEFISLLILSAKRRRYDTMPPCSQIAIRSLVDPVSRRSVSLVARSFPQGALGTCQGSRRDRTDRFYVALDLAQSRFELIQVSMRGKTIRDSRFKTFFC